MLQEAMPASIGPARPPGGPRYDKSACFHLEHFQADNLYDLEDHNYVPKPKKVCSSLHKSSGLAAYRAHTTQNA